MRKAKKRGRLALHRETLRTLTASDMRLVPGALFSMQTDTTCTDLTFAESVCECGDTNMCLPSLDDCSAACFPRP
jgi:hypothetical protein